MEVALIWAMARNRVIGRANALPWHLPRDMQHFMRTTMGKPVIMGRRTFESMKAPLAGRTNIVLTRTTAYARPGIEVARGLDEALAIASRRCALDDVGEAMVIGGAVVYADALSRSHRLYVTHIEAEIEGDTCFPEFDWQSWREVRGCDQPADQRHAYAFRISVYERASAAAGP